MTARLNEICSIGSGVYQKPGSHCEVYYLQARNFDQHFNLKEDIKPVLSSSEQLIRHFIHKGDVLVASKGNDNFAVAFGEEVKPVVASSMFLVLREIDRKLIFPEYLAWYINHPSTQDLLCLLAKGTNLPSINKKILGNLEIEIPSLKKQQLILKVSALRLRERQIKDKLEELEEKQLNQQLLKVVKNG